MSQNATYSMIITQLLNDHRDADGMSLSDFLTTSGLSQSTWSRISRGISHFSIEELRATCNALSLDLSEIIKTADRLARDLPEAEGVNVLDNLKGTENKSILPTIIAGAALAFLISRTLKK